MLEVECESKEETVLSSSGYLSNDSFSINS